MTQEEKAKAYDEALERVNKQRADYQKELDKTDKNSQLAALLRAGISAIDIAFPELRESEDERMRKMLIARVRSAEELTDELREWILTYLEKQKEPENVSASTMIPSCWAEKQKEQKPAGNKKEEMTEFEQSVYDLCPVLGIEEAKATASDLLELAKKTLLKTGKVVLTSNYPEGCSFEDGFHLGYNEGFNTKQKEQKPAESSNEDAIQKAYKEGINDGIALVKKQPEDYGLQKLAKWSEGDETCLQDALWCIEKAEEVAKGENDMGICWCTRRWLKFLPERFNLQPKQEWSDEDEERIQSILFSIGYCKDEYPNKKDYSKDIDWLKSIRPHWKPNKDEERLINTSISFLKDFADKGYENAVECIDWLKSKLNGNTGK